MTREFLRRPGLLLLIAVACSSSDDRATRIIKGAAIKEGVVTGFVIDDETEVPVPAEVLVGGTPVRARADGSFEAPVATAGRVRVEVRSDGYLKTFRDVVAAQRSQPMPFKVAQRGPKKVVGPAGGMVEHRGASLMIAANAFGSDAEVALTYLTRVRVAAITATPQFIDGNGIPRRAVALVDVDANQMPTTAMRARVPVPADATAETVSGFVIDGSGNWTSPMPPAVVADGFAEFVLTGNIQIGVAVDTRKADGTSWATSSPRRGTAARPRATSSPARPRSWSATARPPSSISRAAASSCRRHPRPRRGGGGRRPAGRQPGRPYAGGVSVSAGRARVVVPPPWPARPRTSSSDEGDRRQVQRHRHRLHPHHLPERRRLPRLPRGGRGDRRGGRRRQD
jgi:hypothetical protein